MNAVSKDVIVTVCLVWFMILGLLPAPPAYAQKQIKAAQATSVEFLTARGQKVTYLKVGDKEWNQVSANAKLVCQETNRDEWSVYLSCLRPNSNRKITVVLNLFKKEITRTLPNGRVRKFKISKVVAAPDYSKANQDVTSVDYTSGSGTTKFLKIADKTWRQGPVAAKLTWKETGRDESSIYLSRTNPNTRQEQKVTLNLQTKQVLIYSRPGFAPTGFTIAKINRAPSRAAPSAQNCSLSDWAGEWNTNLNLISWKAQSNGSLSGTYNTQKHYIQAKPVSGNPCVVEGTYRHRDGISKGSIKFTMNPDKLSFKGAWSAPTVQPTGVNWTGTKKTPTVVTPTPNTTVAKKTPTVVTPTPNTTVAKKTPTVVTPTPNTSSTGNSSARRVSVEKCSEGYIPAADGECVLRIWFLPKPSVTLAQAKSLAQANNMVLATPAQIKYAWEKGMVDAYAFGMLRDGSFAVPVQRDYPDFKRGANLNATGKQAEGYFVALRKTVETLETATRSGAEPPVFIVVNYSASNPAPAFEVVPDRFYLRPFYCQTGPKNLMLDGWDSGTIRPLLEEAGKLWLAKKKIAYSPSSLKTLETKLKNGAGTNNVLRWEFAPFMLRVAWQALTAPRPTSAQLAFRKVFETYAPCEENKLNRITLSMWNRHIGKGNDVGSGTHWIGNRPPYKNVGLGITLDTGPTTEGFLPLDNPLHLGPKGNDAVSLLYKPMLAKNLPEYDDRENLRALSDEEMTKTAVGVGLGSAFGGGAAFYTAMGSVFLKEIYSNVARTASLADDIAARSFEETLRTVNGAELAKEGKSADYIEKYIAKEMSEWHEERVAKKLLEEAGEKGGKKVGQEAGEKAGQKGASKLTTQAGEKTIKILGKKLSTRLLANAAANVLGGAAFFASVFGEVLAQHVKTIEYDKALRKGAEQITPLDVQKYLADGSESKKVKLFTQLVKMTIADPADAGLLIMELPEFGCGFGDIRSEFTGWCVRDVKFHPRPGSTQAEAEKIAFQNGWQLASTNEIDEAWSMLNLNSPAWGRMADGRFAYPVQQKTGQLAPGINTANQVSDNVFAFSSFEYSASGQAKGENKGFYYVKKHVEFYNQNNLTLAQAKQKAAILGGKLATPQEVEIAWQKQGLDVFAYGMISDGRFAVPVQKDISRFKRGANIGVTGGNQGFFFVQQKEVRRYYRGQTPMTCPPGSETDPGGLCYQPCPQGYKGIATRCYKSCPTGFSNNGLYCGKPKPYTRPGYRWEPGDPPLPNYSGPRGRCEARWGRGKCQQVGALFYPKCKPGFYNAGSDVCSPQCPTGMTDIGVSCAKNFIDRGIGKPVNYCKPDFPEKVGLLCYAVCRRGYVGKFAWCTNPKRLLDIYGPPDPQN